jgi:HlyD family secretion protein
VVTQNVVSYTTVIDVPNPGLKLKPGMTANVNIEIARADNVLRVPAAALRFRPPSAGEPAQAEDRARGSQVWVWTGTMMQPSRVQTGLSDGTMIAVTGGDLAEGAEVVTGLADATQRADAGTTTSPLLPFGGRRGAAGQGARGGR